MSDIDENSDRRLSDTSEKYEGTEHYTLVKTKDGWHGDPDGYSWQWFDFPDITFTDDGDCHFGLEAEAIDPEIPYVNAVERDKILHLGQERAIPFDLDKNVVFEKEIFLPEHSNGMRFKALDADGRVLLNEVYFSVGGGTVARQDEMASRSEREPYKVPYDFESCSQLMTLCEKHNLTIAELVMANETALRPAEEVEAGIAKINRVMQHSLERGMKAQGILPGGLNIERRAHKLYQRLEETFILSLIHI